MDCRSVAHHAAFVDDEASYDRKSVAPSITHVRFAEKSGNLIETFFCPRRLRLWSLEIHSIEENESQ